MLLDYHYPTRQVYRVGSNKGRATMLVRSFFGAVDEWLSRWTVDPESAGSNPVSLAVGGNL